MNFHLYIICIVYIYIYVCVCKLRDRKNLKGLLLVITNYFTQVSYLWHSKLDIQTEKIKWAKNVPKFWRVTRALAIILGNSSGAMDVIQHECLCECSTLLKNQVYKSVMLWNKTEIIRSYAKEMLKVV